MQQQLLGIYAGNPNLRYYPGHGYHHGHGAYYPGYGYHHGHGGYYPGYGYHHGHGGYHSGR